MTPREIHETIAALIAVIENPETPVEDSDLSHLGYVVHQRRVVERDRLLARSQATVLENVAQRARLKAISRAGRVGG